MTVSDDSGLENIELDSRPLVAKIAEVLRSRIGSGELTPGQKIRQDVFAEAMGVSRTPIREAFQVLAAEGWVTVRPRAGVVVRDLSADEVQEIALMRLLLEPFAAQLAAVNHDEKDAQLVRRLLDEPPPTHGNADWFNEFERTNKRFHFVIYGIGRGFLPGTVETAIGQYWDRFTRYRRYHWASEAEIPRSNESHEQVFRAWSARDADATYTEVGRHIIPVAAGLVHRIDADPEFSHALRTKATEFGIDLQRTS